VNLREFKRTGHWPTLLCAFLYFDSSFALWTLIGALGVFIGQTFHLSPAQKGLLVSIPLLGGSILRIVQGAATDHFRPRKVGIAGMVLTLVPLVWGWTRSTSLTDMWGIGLLLGIAGASFAVGIPFVSRWFTADRQGTALCIYGVGNIGTAVAVFSMPMLVQTFGGRQGAFLFFLVPVTIMAIVFWLFARDAPGRVGPKPLCESAAALSREPMAWHLSLFYFVTFGGFVFFANCLPQLLGDWFPQDRRDARRDAMERETHTVGKRILETINANVSVADERQNLVCQDTGLAVYYVRLGERFPLHPARIEHALREGTREVQPVSWAWSTSGPVGAELPPAGSMVAARDW